MFKFTTVLLYCICHFVNSADVSGYYWRDFDGSIPVDAFPGGLDSHNKPIYIGKALGDNIIVPAKIPFSGDTAYYEYGNEEHPVKNNVMILCTQHPEQFVWIPTNNEELKKLKKVYIVNGGFEVGTSTYIGRVRHGGEVVVGKALGDTSLNEGCHITQNGKVRRFSSFEVLSFQPVQS